MIEPLARACAWVDANLEAFAFDRDREFRFASLKALAELAHAADVLSTCSGATASRWLDYAWSELEGGQAIAAIIDEDVRFAPLAITFLPFHLAGRTNAALAKQIAELDATKLDRRTAMLLAPALRLFGVHSEHAGLSIDRPSAFSEDDSYIFAHECLYASAFGRQRPDWTAETVGYVTTTTNVLLERYAHDADVLAELTFVRHASLTLCVGESAWAALARAQTASGNIVAIEKTNTAFPRVRHRRLARTYHSTLAAIMAWASCETRCSQRDVDVSTRASLSPRTGL
jgi:hypothetical protein